MVEIKHKMPFLETLDKVDRITANVNLSYLMKQQNVCALYKDKLKKVFTEYYISADGLKNYISGRMDERDINSIFNNSWLFLYVSELMDKINLSCFRSNKNLLDTTSPMSLSLVLSNIQTKQFDDFNDSVPQETRKNVILEFGIADIFSHLTLYFDTHKILKELGYKVCINGLNLLSFLHMDKSIITSDFVKIKWDAKLAAKLNDESYIDKIQQKVNEFGKSRVILAACDDEDTVLFGKMVGISLYQGEYIDMLNSL